MVAAERVIDQGGGFHTAFQPDTSLRLSSREPFTDQSYYKYVTSVIDQLTGFVATRLYPKQRGAEAQRSDGTGPVMVRLTQGKNDRCVLELPARQIDRKDEHRSWMKVKRKMHTRGGSWNQLITCSASCLRLYHVFPVAPIEDVTLELSTSYGFNALSATFRSVSRRTLTAEEAQKGFRPPREEVSWIVLADHEKGHWKETVGNPDFFKMIDPCKYDADRLFRIVGNGIGYLPDEVPDPLPSGTVSH